MAKRNLSVVTERNRANMVTDLVAQIPTSDISRDMSDIFDHVYKSHYRKPPLLRKPPRVAPLSPNIGMGMGYDWSRDGAVIHIDTDFLARSLVRANRRSYLPMTRYFIDSAIAHTFVKDSPVIQERRKYSDHEAMTAAWRWAGAIAVKQLTASRIASGSVVDALRDEARETEADFLHDSLYYFHLANVHGVEKPKLQPVPPWIGIAFPGEPGSQQA